MSPTATLGKLKFNMVRGHIRIKSGQGFSAASALALGQRQPPPTCTPPLPRAPFAQAQLLCIHVFCRVEPNTLFQQMHALNFPSHLVRHGTDRETAFNMHAHHTCANIFCLHVTNIRSYMPSAGPVYLSIVLSQQID